MSSPALDSHGYSVVVAKVPHHHFQILCPCLSHLLNRVKWKVRIFSAGSNLLSNNGLRASLLQPPPPSSRRLVLHSHPDSQAIPIRSWHRLLHHDVMLCEWLAPSSRWHSPRLLLLLLPPSPRAVTSQVTVPRRRQLLMVQDFVITPVVTGDYQPGVTTEQILGPDLRLQIRKDSCTLLLRV